MIDWPGETGDQGWKAAAGGPEALVDVLFLVAVVALSAMLYVPGLGLYSDDWAILAHMHSSADRSLTGLYDALRPAGIGTRPLQGALLAFLYSLFGLEPLGYHVANVLMLAAMVVLLYLSLRRLAVPRVVAFAVPIVFATLPHYSTGRVWIAAFQAPLSVLLYLVGLYADIRFLRASGPGRWAWRALGVAALLGSVLAYEITAGLFLLHPVVLAVAARATAGSDRALPVPPATRRAAVLLGTNLVALALAVAYKAGTTGRTAFLEGLLWRIRSAAEGSARIAFGSYGVALPRTVGRVVRDHFDPAVLGLSLLVGVAAWLYMTRTLDARAPRSLSRLDWSGLLAAGLAAFAAGYGVALFTFEIGFDTTGINNRTAQGAALGVAVTFVAGIGWTSSWIRSDRAAWTFFRLAVAALAASGCLIVNTIAAHWVEASRRQQEVIETVRGRFDRLPSGTVLLLDGLCPYIGPGLVFETNWDVSAMLQLEYGDPSLSGDVLKPDTEVTPAGTRTILYDDVINVYPYGSHLWVLNVVTAEAHQLGTRTAAETYFAGRAAGASCPPGEEGYGVRIF